MLEIRALDPADIEPVGSVLGLARLHQGDGFYLVAWESDVPVGHLHIAMTDPPEIQDVEVRTEYRRRRVASALTARAEHEVRSRGFDRLRLSVSVADEAAQHLYRRNGYRESDVPPRHVRGTIQLRSGSVEVDDTLLTWEKHLDRPDGTLSDLMIGRSRAAQ